MHAPVFAVAALLKRGVTRTEAVRGGDINEAWCMELEGGERVFVKSRPEPAPGEYEAEAEGLRWLDDAGALRVPGVRGADERHLVLDWVEPGRRLSPAGEEELGRGLAALHAAGARAFGATPHGGSIRIGPIELPAEPKATWPAFYAGSVLQPLLRGAVDRGALPSGGADAVQRVCGRIDQLAGPPEPPARLHGDLWSGNVMAGEDGRPWLVDPAAHGGHREMDLAMLRLFGPPGPHVIPAYEEAAPLADGHEERVALWQLQPLLAHAVLFGGSYGEQVERAARSII